MTRLVLAGVSVRALAQAARRDGLDVVAFDAFGDADTREACERWQPLPARPGSPVDGQALAACLHALVQQDGREWLGWVPGSGFEPRDSGLEAAAEALPLLGTAPAAVRRVRDPALFFGVLDARGIEHPPVQLRPVTSRGWLRKDFGGSGGEHIHAADAPDLPPATGQTYWQQWMAGQPLSLTLIGNGSRAALLGANRLLCGTDAAHPWRYTGVIGPLPWPSGRRQTAWQGLADRLVAAFELRGLCGIDLLLDGERCLVLEVNARPPASLVLYGRGGGLMQAHLRACCQGRLPDAAALAALRGGLAADAVEVGGQAVVHAPRPLRLDPRQLERLRQDRRTTHDLHDLPSAPIEVAAWQPVCSVSARAADPDTVARLLSQRHDHILNLLDT